MRRVQCFAILSVVFALGVVAAPRDVLAQSKVETVCDDGIDDDKDSMIDCGDADCFESPKCKPDGRPESSNARCSDWVDNDEDGQTDCDDSECQDPDIKVCLGSWDLAPTAAVRAPVGTPELPEGNRAPASTDTSKANESQPMATQSNPEQRSSFDPGRIPELGEGETLEDLIGRFGDNDGERNDYLCSDGVDNDQDGMIDCADFGCRFDPQVTVCRGETGMRFSVVAGATHTYFFKEVNGGTVHENRHDTKLSRLQLRALGPIPLIENSFFLISARIEKTPRISFALFQVPLGGGHTMTISNGGSNLSWGRLVSTSKQLLVDPAFYLFNNFEQGVNGASIEFAGPVPFVPRGKLDYRGFASGGSGRFSGNLGGSLFPLEENNYSWGAGLQVNFNALGYISRFDTPYLYVKAPVTLGVRLGAKYDQAETERYPAVNAGVTFRYLWFHVGLESYTKREINFGSWQQSYNAQVGVLIWPKHLLLAADFGQFLASDFEKAAPDGSVAPDDETMFRAALHYYFYGQIGIASVMFIERYLGGELNERSLQTQIQFRF